jgi:hypothetical protein
MWQSVEGDLLASKVTAAYSSTKPTVNQYSGTGNHADLRREA